MQVNCANNDVQTKSDQMQVNWFYNTVDLALQFYTANVLLAQHNR